MLRVLIVDDSALYRKTIGDLLKADPNIEIVGTARNGRFALEKLPRLQPDVITLDMEMPEMGGLETLEVLRKEHPEVKTVIFSAHTERGAELTIKALNLGAIDFVTKPRQGQTLDASLEQMKRDLLPKIQVFAPRSGNGKTQAPAAERSKPVIETPVKLPPVEYPKPVLKRRSVIAIGISTGGPQSLEVFFGNLPSAINQTLLIVQHMPPIFTRKLAEQLSRNCTIPVTEAEDGEVIQSGRAYIAPGGQHMTVENKDDEKIIKLNSDPPVNFCRPSVDVLFRSVVEAYGQQSIGVVMTGMGDDGLAGSKMMKTAGIPVIAQDEETSVVWGMPGAIARNGLADRIVPLNDIFRAICDFSL